jgi:REP element-mobilizing transposase RayT
VLHLLLELRNEAFMKKGIKYNPHMHNRQSNRLQDYDYSQAGLYFITICVHEKECIFGTIKNNMMELNEAGDFTNNCWLEIPLHFPNVELHNHIVMPNHIHGIIEFVGAKNLSPKTRNYKSTSINPEKNLIVESESDEKISDKKAKQEANRAKDFSPLPMSPSKTIGSVVRGFKIGVTKWFRKNTDIYTVWQRNYYDHIIRDKRSYLNISDYIKNNPARWTEDMFYKSPN